MVKQANLSVTGRYRKGPLWQMAAIAMSIAMRTLLINFCILALGSGQRLLHRLGSGLGLVLVLVCAYCSACADLCDSGPESICHIAAYIIESRLAISSSDEFLVCSGVACVLTVIQSAVTGCIN